jgi:hypothetical protein
MPRRLVTRIRRGIGEMIGKRQFSREIHKCRVESAVVVSLLNILQTIFCGRCQIHCLSLQIPFFSYPFQNDEPFIEIGRA